MNKILLSLFVLAIAFVQPLLIVPVQAQTPYRGVVVRLPATAERYVQIDLEPGKQYTGSFILQHEYQDRHKSVKLYIYASDFIYDNNNETVAYPDDSLNAGGSYSLSKWVKFDRSELTLDHYGQEETIHFTVDVPTDATPGARYANIIVSNAPFLSETAKDDIIKDVEGAAIVTRLVVTTLLVTVSGEKDQNVYLEDLRVTDAKGNSGLWGTNLFEFHPILIRFKLRNMGNQVLLPGGDVFIDGGDVLNPVLKTELNPNHERLLPNSQHTFTTTWADSAFTLDKNGFISINTDNILKLNWGHYFVQINMLYRDASGKLGVIPAKVDFWVIPWKPIAVIAVLALVLGLYSLHRYRTGVVFISREKQQKLLNSRRYRWTKRVKGIISAGKDKLLAIIFNKRPKSRSKV